MILNKLGQLRTYLITRPILRNVVILVTGTTVAQLLGVIAAPILTRLYTPVEFGLLTVYIALLALFALLGTLQYENAIPLPESDEDAANLLVLSFFILAAICLISTATLWFGRELISSYLHISQLAAFLWLIPLSLMGMGTYNILSSWSVRKKTFGRIAQTKVTQSVGMVSTMIALGIFQQGIIGLLLGDMIGRMSGGLRLTYLIVKEDVSLLKKVSWQGIRQIAVRFNRFPKYSVISSLIRELSEQLPALFLAVAYGPWVVGLFMLVQRVLGMPISLIGYSVSNVYMAEAAKHMQNNDSARILKLYWQTIKHLLLIAVPILILLSIGAPKLFPLVFGSQWSEAGTYLRILCPMYLFQFLSIPISTTLYVYERQDLQFFREIIRIMLLLVAIVMVMVADLQPLYAFSLLSTVGCLSFFIYGFVSWLAIKQNLQVVQNVTV